MIFATQLFAALIPPLGETSILPHFVVTVESTS
jgi:hypothetical protein